MRAREWGLAAAIAVAVIAGSGPGAVPRPAQAADDVAELRSRFDAAVAADDGDDAQDVGRKLLSGFPDDPSALHVLRAFTREGWRWPRLKTSFATLRRWEGSDVDDAREPDLRIAVVEAIESLYPKEEVVKEGGTLYIRLWCHLRAGRFDETVRLGKTFLRRYRKSITVDKVRWAMASAYLGMEPPDEEEATKLLEWLVTGEGSRYVDRAKRKLDELRMGGRWIAEPADGRPTAEGLGKMAVLTDLSKKSPLWEALEDWREARGAEVVRFKAGRPADAEEALRKLGVEFVAVVVEPATVDVNFHWEMLELCRRMDDDPLPDFHFGYLTARDAEDLRSLAARSLAPPEEGAPKLGSVGVPQSVAAVAAYDAFMHIGHGLPTGIGGGLDAPDLEAASLPRAPVVFSGACFNGVLGRSFEDSAMVPVVRRPKVYAPHDLISMAWIHAGAVGVVAALEGDRGEMAGAEWAHYLATACTLGEAVGLGYRHVFTSLPESFEEFRRYRVGYSRDQSLYQVMLRGQTSRILLGDPAARPVAQPTASPSTKTDALLGDGGGLVVSVAIADDADLTQAQFLFTNTLTASGMNNQGFTERRIFGRVELPAGLTGHPGRPAVGVSVGERRIEPDRVCVRHEVWGGRRYLCVQVETRDRGIVARGARAVFTFPAED